MLILGDVNKGVVEMKLMVSKKVFLKVMAGIVAASSMILSFSGIAMAEGDNDNCEDTIVSETVYDDCAIGDATESIEVAAETSEELTNVDKVDVEAIDDDIELVGALKEYSENGINYKEINDGTYSAVSYTGNATSISIPEKVDGTKVTVIATNFLYNNSNAANITSITLTNNIYRIEENAFRGCTNLKQITLGSKEDFVMFGDRAIITNLTSIGDYAFEGCTSLTSIDLSPIGLATIGKGAFSGCTSLSTVKLSHSIIYIGADAFLNCTGLANGAVYYTRDIEDWLKITYGDEGPGAHPNFYAKATYLSYYTEEQGWGFKTEHKYQPTSFTASTNQRIITPYAFAGFKELQDVDLTECNTIGAGAFANCTNLNTVKLSDLLSILGECAFMNDAHIYEIYLGKGLSSIPSKAFSGCSKINNLKFTKNVNSIAADAFEKCTSLSLVYVYTGSKAASYFEYEFNECETGTFVAYVDNTSTYQIDSVLIGYSGLFDGSLGMRFYFTKNGYDDKSTAKFMYTDARGKVVNETYSFSEEKNANDSYIFTVSFNPIDANTKIGAKIIDSNGNESKTYWISFVDYAKQIISNPGKYGTEYNEAIQAILTYCDAVQRYFNVDYGSIPSALQLSSDQFYTTKAYVDFEKRELLFINNTDFLGCSFDLCDKLSLKLYFKGNYSDIVISCEDTYFGNINDHYDVQYVANAYTVVTIKDIYSGANGKYGSYLSPTRIFNIKYGSTAKVDRMDVLSYLYVASLSENENLKYLANATSMMDFYVGYTGSDEKLVQK